MNFRPRRSTTSVLNPRVVQVPQSAVEQRCRVEIELANRDEHGAIGLGMNLALEGRRGDARGPANGRFAQVLGVTNCG
jgi:hypothetical protein